MNHRNGHNDAWHDHVLGALLGAACGDALGAPFEGTANVDPSVFAGWARASRPLRWTDDTALLLATAEHLVATEGHIDTESLARDYAEAWAAEPDRGYGTGPVHIFTDVLARRDWRTTTASLFGGSGSHGNGAAMRVAPIGLLPNLRLPQVADLARRSAAVTHVHPLGMEGAVIQAVAVAIAARGRHLPLSPTDFLRAVSGELQLSEYRLGLQAAHALVRLAKEPSDVAEHLGNDTSAASTVPAALTAFLRHPDDPAQALRFAILIGGDTDTIAAMTGAIAGARCGATALPPTWLERLEQRHRIECLASKLHQLSRIQPT
jgi:poly(ADP-ribose) glycohydrolase ARH3